MSLRNRLLMSFAVVVLVGLSATAYFLFFTSKHPRIGGGNTGLPLYKGEWIKDIGKSELLAQLPEESLISRKKELEDLADNILKQPANTDFWIYLGSLKKFFFDYKGAEDAWEYAALIDQKNPLPYYNLANLYSYYLNDIEKGEEYYLTTIDKDPLSLNVYTSLAAFYRDFYKDFPEKEEAVLLRGLKEVPSDPNILLGLGDLYKRSGNIKKAIEYFEKVLKIDTSNKAVKEQLQELKSLLKT